MGTRSFHSMGSTQGAERSCCQDGENAGLSEATKAQYQAAWSLAKKAQVAMGEDFKMPRAPRTTILFVVYARSRHHPSLKASTIKAYLAGIRMQHFMRGHGGRFEARNCETHGDRS